MIDSGDGVLAAATASATVGRGVEVPYETMHSRGGCRARERTDPIGRDIELRVGSGGLVCAFESREDFAGGVEDVDYHGA